MKPKIQNIEKWIKENKCFYCGKNANFQCWQFYNVDSKNKDKHDYCWWCSARCLNRADRSDTKISGLKGKFHIHKGSATCYGEFSYNKNEN